MLFTKCKKVSKIYRNSVVRFRKNKNTSVVWVNTEVIDDILDYRLGKCRQKKRRGYTLI